MVQPGPGALFPALGEELGLLAVAAGPCDLGQTDEAAFAYLQQSPLHIGKR